MIKFFVSLGIIALLFSACTNPVKGKNGVTFRTAIEYNDYIVEKQDTVIKLIDKFEMVADTSTNELNAFLADATLSVEKMIIDVEGMPEWKGNTEMRDKGVRMLEYYKSIFAVSYKRLIEITADGEISQAEEKDKEDVIKKMTDDGTLAEDAFFAAQKEFASKNNVRLENKAL